MMAGVVGFLLFALPLVAASEGEGKHAAWAWLRVREGDGRELNEEDLVKARRFGVSRLWLSVGSSFREGPEADRRFARLFGKARRLFPQVGMLMGEANWLSDPDAGRRQLRNAVLWFWQNYPLNGKLEINLDVEPQQLGEWKENVGQRAELMEKLVELVCSLRRELSLLEPRATLVLSLNLGLSRRYLPEVGERLRSCGVDGVALMDYRPKVEGMGQVVDRIDCAKFLAYWLGVNLKPSSPASFGGEISGRSLKGLLSSLSGRGGECLMGIALHSVNYLSGEEEKDGQ